MIYLCYHFSLNRIYWDVYLLLLTLLLCYFESNFYRQKLHISCLSQVDQRILCFVGNLHMVMSSKQMLVFSLRSPLNSVAVIPFSVSMVGGGYLIIHGWSWWYEWWRHYQQEKVDVVVSWEGLSHLLINAKACNRRSFLNRYLIVLYILDSPSVLHRASLKTVSYLSFSLQASW